MRWEVADLGFCGGFEAEGWGFFSLSGIKSLVGVVSWGIDKKWCFVVSFFTGLWYIRSCCRFQWAGNKEGLKH